MQRRTWKILTLLLIGLVGLPSVAQSQLSGDDYGSISFKALGLSKDKGTITISGEPRDFTAEVKAKKEGRLYFTQTITPVSVASMRMSIGQAAGSKYQPVLKEIDRQWDDNFSLEQLQSILDNFQIKRPSWRYHFFGYYYDRKARERLEKESGEPSEKVTILSSKKKRELFFPAIEKYKAAIRNDPAFPMPHLNLAYIYAELGETESATHECRLAAKCNWDDVLHDANGTMDAFGINDYIEILKNDFVKTAYEQAVAQFSSGDYDRKSRLIRPEVDNRMRSDEDAQNMEIFVESMQKYLRSDEKARLYHNLGYYYHTRRAYRLAVANYKRAFKVDSRLDKSALEGESIPEIIYNNIRNTYEKLDWLEWEEVALVRKNPFKEFPFEEK